MSLNPTAYNASLKPLRFNEPGDLVVKRRLPQSDTYEELVLRPIANGFLAFDANGNPVTLTAAELRTALEAAADDLSNAAAQAALKPLSLLGSRQRLGATKPQGISSAAFPANFTIDLELPISTPFAAVRIIAYNTGAAAATWGNTAIAAAPSSGSDGTALTWSQVTWNAPTNPTKMPGFASGSTASVTVPAATGSGANAIPGVAFSDWITLASLARSDGGLYSLLRVRMWEAAGLSVGQENNTNRTAYVAALPELCPRSAVSADATGAKVTAAASNAITPTLAGDWTPPIIVEFRTSGSERVITLCSVGDSITAGTRSGTGVRTAGYIDRAAFALSSPAQRVSHVNLGFPSSQAWPFFQRGKLVLDWFLPSALFIIAGSPNDGSNIACYVREAEELAALCIARGCQPVLVTAIPRGVADDSERQALNTEVRRAATRPGVALLDADLIIRDPADIDSIAPEYLGDDAIHPGETGHAALGAGAAAVVNSLLA